MNLIRHKMTKLHHVDVTNDHLLVERIAAATIKQARLAVFLHPAEAILLFGFTQIVADLFLLDPVEDWSRHFESECLGSNAEVRF